MPTVYGQIPHQALLRQEDLTENSFAFKTLTVIPFLGYIPQHIVNYSLAMKARKCDSLTQLRTFARVNSHFSVIAGFRTLLTIALITAAVYFRYLSVVYAFVTCVAFVTLNVFSKKILMDLTKINY